MSHVVNIELEIKDLKSLKEAAEMLGLEFRENQKTYRWYGHHVGDYPLPKGFTKFDMGHCDHALSIPGNPNAYEVGVCKRRDGVEGWLLQFDFYAGGNGLISKIGKDAGKLCDEYAAAVAKRKLKAKGFMVKRTVTSTGKIILQGIGR